MFLCTAVNALEQALLQDGWAAHRDNRDLKSSKLISTYMNQLTHGHLVVAIVSDKYLRFHACMYEIYRLWQRFQGDAEQMVQHVLPGVRIATLLERSVYSDHWEGVNEQNQALLKKEGSKLGRQSFAEVKLIEAFTQEIDDLLAYINDVLMPRSLPDLLGNGFEPVRAALGERVAAL